MDGGRRLLEGEQLKPKNLGVTLARFGGYFKPYGLVLVVVMTLVV